MGLRDESSTSRRSVACAIVFALALGAGAIAQAAPTPTADRVGPPDSIAVIGDSISTATGTGLLGAETPNNSWATGNNATVNSNYRRILAINPAINGNNHNMASNGRRMTHAAQQGSSLPLDTEYVMIEMGGNDLCQPTVAQMTSIADYRAQFQAALGAIKARVPNALIFVASIPDIYNLWFIRGAPNPPNPNQSNQAGQARTYWAGGIIPCQSLLTNPTSMAQADVDRREAVRQRNKDFNAVLAEECGVVLRCRYDDHALFTFSSNRVDPPDGALLPHAEWNFTDLDISRNTISFCPLTGLFSPGCGDHFHPSLAGQAKLAEGTWESSYDFTDATAPALAFSADPAPNGAGWNNGPVTVGLSAVDDAPIRGYEYRLHRPSGAVTDWTEVVGETAEVEVTDEGLSYVEARAMDVNGNLSASDSHAVQIDTTAPSVALVTPPDGAVYTLGEQVNAAYTCADEVDGSGIASCVGDVADGDPIDTASVGTKSFSVTATDNAGNETTTAVSYQVTYAFGGFKPPIKAPSHQAKAGSTIPVKFALADSDGSPVGTAETSFSLAPAGGGPAVLTGGPFNYDAGDQHYILPVSTQGVAPGSYILTVHLDDETEHSVGVNLR